MLGEFKKKVQNALLYVLSIIPKKDSYGEVFRGKGKWADCNISVDDENYAVALYYNVQKKEVGGYIEQQFEKSGVSAGWIALDPDNRFFDISIADGSNANSGDWVNPFSILHGQIVGTFPDIEGRVGIGLGNFSPSEALHLRGKIHIEDSPITTVTAATATAGTATLPSNPVMFLIVKVNGIDYKIPLYGV